MTDMPIHTTTQFAILVLALIAGWLFGLASHPGGRRWKDRARALEADLKGERETLAARDRRITELEGERDRLANERDRIAAERDRLSNAHGDTVHPAASATVAKEERAHGWLGWGHDELTRIDGIDAERRDLLKDAGVDNYRSIEELTDDDVAALEHRIGLKRGTIDAENWRAQAHRLRTGD